MHVRELEGPPAAPSPEPRLPAPLYLCWVKGGGDGLTHGRRHPPTSRPWFYPVVEQHDVTYHRVKPLTWHQRQRHNAKPKRRKHETTANGGKKTTTGTERETRNEAKTGRGMNTCDGGWMERWVRQRRQGWGQGKGDLQRSLCNTPVIHTQTLKKAANFTNTLRKTERVMQSENTPTFKARPSPWEGRPHLTWRCRRSPAPPLLSWWCRVCGEGRMASHSWSVTARMKFREETQRCCKLGLFFRAVPTCWKESSNRVCLDTEIFTWLGRALDYTDKTEEKGTVFIKKKKTLLKL